LVDRHNMADGFPQSEPVTMEGNIFHIPNKNRSANNDDKNLT
jgi:hypothetical protein